MEAEGAFVDDRGQYLLSALCQLYLLYLSSKGSSIEELMLFFGEPAAVQMRKPTAEEKQKSAEKKSAQNKQFAQGLIAIAKGEGTKVKTVTSEEFYKELKDVL